MDERIFGVKIGSPVPDWDLKHRLGINSLVGPECKDSATIYRINSTYMDISEQPHMSRQWVAAGTLIAALFFLICAGFFIFLYNLSDGLKWDFWINFSMIILGCNAFGFAYVGANLGVTSSFH